MRKDCGMSGVQKMIALGAFLLGAANAQQFVRSDVVRFPNSLCCELGERSVKNRGIEVLRSIVAKIYIESG